MTQPMNRNNTKSSQLSVEITLNENTKAK